MAPPASPASSPPWWFPQVAVRHVGWTLTGVVVVVAAMAAFPIHLGHGELTEETDYDWIIASGTSSKRMDAVDAAIGLVDDGDAAGGRRALQQVGASERSHWSDRNRLYLSWMAQDAGTIFTPAHLQTICEVENQLLAHESYPSLCRLETWDPNTTLGPPISCAPSIDSSAPPAELACACARQSCQWSANGGCSVAEAFYSAHTHADGSRDCARLSSAAVASVLQRGSVMQELFFIGREITTKGFTSRTRSLLKLGSPTTGYRVLPSDGRKDVQQTKVLNPFWAVIEEALLSAFGMSDYMDGPTEVNQLTVVFWAHVWEDGIFSDTVAADLNWALGSIVFVLVVLCYHTGSVFLGGLGMLQILLSLPCSLCIYRSILGIDFVTQMHVLTIYLVLGVGADDLFVFFDAWVQSEFEPRVLAAVATDGAPDTGHSSVDCLP